MDIEICIDSREKVREDYSYDTLQQSLEEESVWLVPTVLDLSLGRPFFSFLSQLICLGPSRWCKVSPPPLHPHEINGSCPREQWNIGAVVISLILPGPQAAVCRHLLRQKFCQMSPGGAAAAETTANAVLSTSFQKAEFT